MLIFIDKISFKCYNFPMKENKRKSSSDDEEECVLYDRKCIGCGECELCDLDPLKICDNCGKCIEMRDVASIKLEFTKK